MPPGPLHHARMKRLGTPVLAATLALAGCADFKTEKPDDKDKPKPAASLTLIGRIASIPPDKQFVLIQTYEKRTLEAGIILTTRGEGERSANLKVTGERMGQFAAADVQSGEVILGDAVYSLHVPKSVSPTPEASPTAPAEAGNPPATDTLPPPPDVAPLPELPENQPLPSN
jgi:hypothetical protein